jgi:TetR/AcrR family transcriptional repressor of nem operon
MTTPTSRKQSTHARIVASAARAIRRGGFQGVGVADIMKDAGLTHGGFYAHFRSRDALLCEALARAGEEAGEAMQQPARPTNQHAGAFQTLVDNYLSVSHLGASEHGCPVAALASEMPRQAREVRDMAAKSVRALMDTVQTTLPPAAAPESAAVIAGQLVGSLQLARTLGNNAEGKALLAATRRTLLAQYGLL